MRTTVDLPDDLLVQLKALAQDRRQSLSAVVTAAIRDGFPRPSSPGHIEIDPLTGLPRIYLGRVTTSEDVRALEDDE